MPQKLCNDILFLIFDFLPVSNYNLVNKRCHQRVLQKRKDSVRKISNWYLRYRIQSNAISRITPKILLVKFKSFWISNVVKNRKCCPEYIAPLLNLNLYSLSTLPHKTNKKKRSYKDVLDWLKLQNLSQFEYRSLTEF